MSWIKNINIVFNDKPYEIVKSFNEYLMDEPIGGGKATTFAILEGIPALGLLTLKEEDFDFKVEFLNKIDNEKNCLLILYEAHYHWSHEARETFYYAILRNDDKQYFECKMHESKGIYSIDRLGQKPKL